MHIIKFMHMHMHMHACYMFCDFVYVHMCIYVRMCMYAP
jgi:hypothetical protein